MKSISNSINFILIIFISTLISCSSGGSGSNDGLGGGTTERETEKIRFINAIKSESAVNVFLGSDVLIEELAYGDASSYVESEEGIGDNAISLRINSAERVLPVLSADIDVPGGEKATYLLYDSNDVPALRRIPENARPPRSFESSIRFINASENRSSVDVYLVFPSEGINNLSPALSNIEFSNASTYISFNSAEIDIVYATSGTKNIIRRARAVNFEEGKVYTHILLDNIEGARGQTSRIFEDTLF